MSNFRLLELELKKQVEQTLGGSQERSEQSPTVSANIPQNQTLSDQPSAAKKLKTTQESFAVGDRVTYWDRDALAIQEAVVVKIGNESGVLIANSIRGNQFFVRKNLLTKK